MALDKEKYNSEKPSNRETSVFDQFSRGTFAPLTPFDLLRPNPFLSQFLRFFKIMTTIQTRPWYISGYCLEEESLPRDELLEGMKLSACQIAALKKVKFIATTVINNTMKSATKVVEERLSNLGFSEKERTRFVASKCIIRGIVQRHSDIVAMNV